MTKTIERSFEEVKNLIKERANLPEIVSRHTKIIKTARGYKACCPIHKEKTPSFNIDTRGNYFYCYGCNIGGDVFKFLELTEGLSFFDALKDLAEQLHIELPKQRSSTAEQKAQKTRRDLGFELLNRAQVFYHKYLLQSPSPEATQARSYLQKRGLSDLEIQNFGLGLSPNEPNGLLKKLGSSEEQALAIAADLLRNYEGKVFDSFRSRLMIPIRDSKGRVAGFSGRVLENAANQQPKYKNSSETEWFKKKEILYGLDLASKQIRQEDYVCLVEGYFDQWAFYRKDIPAVAVMGTALSDEHVLQLSRHTQNIILVLDTDKAGLAATQRSLPILLKKEMSVRVFSELNGKDPDEWLAGFQSSNKEIKTKLMTAPSAIEWWTRTRLKEKLAQNPDRLSAIKGLEELWLWTHSAAQKNILADEASRILGLSSADIKESLKEAKAQMPSKASIRPQSTFTPTQGPQNFVRPQNKQKIYLGPLEVSAQESLSLWLQNIEVLGPHSPDEWARFEKPFAETPIAALLPEWKKAWFLDPSPSKRLEIVEKSIEGLGSDSRAQTWLLRALVAKDQSAPGGNDSPEGPAKDKLLKSWDEMSRKIERERVREEIHRLQSQIRQASMDSELSSKLLTRVQELMKELHF